MGGVRGVRWGRGVLLSLDGPDGAGKTTQARRLAARLRRAGKRVVHVREPGGTPVGEAIRRILLSRQGRGPSPRAEALLYQAARADLYERRVVPALRAGRVVVSERSLYATLAYQGYGGGLSLEDLERAGRFAVAGRRPDRVILLDLDPREGLGRIQGPRDRLESRSLAFHRRVRRGFLEMASREPRRFRVVPAGGDPAAVAREVWGAVADVVG